jgi:hypothetical protein
MKSKKFRCRHCRRLIPEKVPGQKYCGSSACQKARKNGWRREKYASDPDYRLNQKASTEAWLTSLGGAAEYYREYRKQRKRVEEARQEAEEKRHSFRGSPSPLEEGDASLFAGADAASAESANRDAEIVEVPIKKGRYRILPEGANSDAFIAEIRVISYG